MINMKEELYTWLARRSSNIEEFYLSVSGGFSKSSGIRLICFIKSQVF